MLLAVHSLSKARPWVAPSQVLSRCTVRWPNSSSKLMACMAPSATITKERPLQRRWEEVRTSTAAAATSDIEAV